MRQRAFNHALRRRAAVFGKDILFDRTGVDADAHRNVMSLYAVGKNLDILFAADIAGIDAQFMNAVFNRFQGELVVKVNISDQRHRTCIHQRTHSLRAGVVVYRNAHDIRARNRQRTDLGKRRFDVRRVRIRHGLHADRSAAANQHISHFNLTCFSAHLSSPRFSYPFIKNRMISL